MDSNEQTRTLLKDKHILGQQCQRNWDLSQAMPEEDIETIIHAVTQCPSKQNLDYYSVIAIQNREIIERIYQDHTLTAKGRKNPQILAHLLLVFVAKKVSYADRSREVRHAYNVKETVANPTSGDMVAAINEDQQQAIGIAGGFATMTATMLGYKTGFNKRFDKTEVNEILNIPKDRHATLMLGIGIPDLTRDRRDEHYDYHIVEAYPKIPIEVEYL